MRERRDNIGFLDLFAQAASKGNGYRNLQLVASDSEILRQTAKPVENVPEKRLQRLIRNMTQIMHSRNGMGLAAPQVGVSLRLVLVTIDGKIYPFINPDIHPIGTEMEIAMEGCLSFPNEYVPVNRYKRIAVAYLDDKYKPKCLDLSGLNARCVQHEFDHLNGTCIK